MKCAQNILLTTSLLVLVTSMPSSAATRGCSFKKSVQLYGLAFDISSRPALGCAVQVVDISARRGGKTFSRLRTDVDYLAEKVWATDLTGDGKPELVIASRSAESEARGALDVYYLDGNAIRRATVPELSDSSGYRGGDRFHRDGRQIVRTIPVYIDGDTVNNPGGGNRTLRYVFSDGVLSVLAQSENQSADIQSLQLSANEKTIVKSASPKPVVKDITPMETVIEITADTPISTYKTMKFSK